MLSAPRRHEIDHHTMKLIVGLIALSLPFLTSYLAGARITSISAAYYEGGWSQSIFVGFLFAIAAFLLAYNGRSTAETVLSKVAAGAALGVALFPCKCGSHTELLPYVHEVSAATMFLILAYFCYTFFKRARNKRYPQAKVRAVIYALCAIAIVLSILVIFVDKLSGGIISARVTRITFYAEWTSLVAFGVGWLTASRAVPGLTHRDEQLIPFGGRAAAYD